jgi:hypothetical protein
VLSGGKLRDDRFAASSPRQAKQPAGSICLAVNPRPSKYSALSKFGFIVFVAQPG